MAEASVQSTQAKRRKNADVSEDSVEAEFGGDNSEATVEAIRSLGPKGAAFGGLDVEEVVALEPPSLADIEAAKKQLVEYTKALEQVKHYTPDARERQWVDYKSQLVEGATPEEVTWLKLKAYHHAVDQLRAARGEDAFGDAAAAASPSGSSAAPPGANGVSHQHDAVLRAIRDLLPSSELDDSSDASPADRLGSHLQASSRPTSQPTHIATVPGLGAPSSYASPAALTADDLEGATYRSEYLEEQRLSRLLAQQRRQRSTAFLASFAAALGFSLLRWARRGRGGGKEDAGRRPQQPQAGQKEA